MVEIPPRQVLRVFEARADLVEKIRVEDRVEKNRFSVDFVELVALSMLNQVDWKQSRSGAKASTSPR